MLPVCICNYVKSSSEIQIVGFWYLSPGHSEFTWTRRLGSAVIFWSQKGLHEQKSFGNNVLYHNHIQPQQCSCRCSNYRVQECVQKIVKSAVKVHSYCTISGQVLSEASGQLWAVEYVTVFLCKGNREWARDLNVAATWTCKTIEWAGCAVRSSVTWPLVVWRKFSSVLEEHLPWFWRQ
jgi:hypothetical protein